MFGLFLILLLDCFSDSSINNNPRTGQQTVASLLTNRKNKCYKYENLQCTESCPSLNRAMSRSLVFNMKPVKTSGKFNFDICVTSDACQDGCCYLATKSLNYLGSGSKTPQIQKYSNHPYNLDVTDLLKGYKDYIDNDTWLSTVSVQVRNQSFKDYSTEENNLPMDLIEPTPHNVVTRDEKKTILIFWDQPQENTIISKANTNIEFFNADGRSSKVWEFASEDENNRAFRNCDLSQLKEVRTPLIRATKGFHYYYNNLTAPSCNETSKVAVYITD